MDISESGIAVMLTELPLGELVELGFMLADGSATMRAMIPQRNAFRYGFEFVDSDAGRERIRRT